MSFEMTSEGATRWWLPDTEWDGIPNCWSCKTIKVESWVGLKYLHWWDTPNFKKVDHTPSKIQASHFIHVCLPNATILITYTVTLLSVFQMISQKPMQLGWPNLTHKCSTTSPGTTLILKSTGLRSRSRLCQYSDKMQYRHCCIHQPCRVFPAVLPHCTNSASDIGISLRQFPTSAAFSRRGLLHSCECWLVGDVTYVWSLRLPYQVPVDVWSKHVQVKRVDNRLQTLRSRPQLIDNSHAHLHHITT